MSRILSGMFVRAVVLSAVLGAAVGAMLPASWPPSTVRVKAATVHVLLQVHPGATPTMNCGWHSACNADPPPYGSALDWANSGGAYVNWRAYGYRSDDLHVPLGTGTINSANNTCKAIQVDIVDAYGAARGAQKYVHSESAWAGASFSILANGTAYGAWHAGAIGTTSSAELTACSTDPDGSGPGQPLWYGAHLHQEPSSGWTVNYGAYCTPVYGDDCEGDYFPNYITPGYQHAYRYWAWVL